MSGLINRLHQSKILGKIFPTLISCLQRELVGCQSVLDIGCGPSSPLQYCTNVEYSVGVEPFEPYLRKSVAKKIHTKYFSRKIEELDFAASSFDAVIMLELIEHLPEEKGVEVLNKAELWARKKIIISTPNGFISQREVDSNLLQRHLSGWGLEKLKDLGYQCCGLAGFKFLRQEVQDDTMGDNLLTSIRWRPKLFWFLVATVSEVVVCRLPNLAFELFCVKNLVKD